MKKIKDLIGKTWMYKGNQVTVEDYLIVDGQVELIVHPGNPIKINRSEIDTEIEKFLPVDTGAGIVLKGDAGRMESLEEILMESIHKVRENPEYINQAKQISNSANTLVNITKTKIMMMKESGRR